MTENAPKFNHSTRLNAGLKCQYINMLLAHPNLSQSASALAVAYLDLSEKEGVAFAGQEFLSFRTNVKSRTITAANRQIQATGLFSFKYRPNKSTIVTPDFSVFRQEYDRFLREQDKVRNELRERNKVTGSAETADPDQQILRAGSAESAGVISLDIPTRPISPDSQEGGSAASTGVIFDQREFNPPSNHPHAPAMQWPVDGLQRLYAIHPPKEADRRYTMQKYYKAKRLYEATVPFEKVESRLSTYVRSDDPAFIARLAVWLDHERWDDDLAPLRTNFRSLSSVAI